MNKTEEGLYILHPSYIETIGRIASNEKFENFEKMKSWAKKRWFPEDNKIKYYALENVLKRIWNIYCFDDGLNAKTPFVDLYYIYYGI